MAPGVALRKLLPLCCVGLSYSTDSVCDTSAGLSFKRHGLHGHWSASESGQAMWPFKQLSEPVSNVVLLTSFLKRGRG